MSDPAPTTAAASQTAFEEGPFRSRDGTLLRFRHATAEGGKARGRVLVVHGFGEHSGRYAHVLRACAAKSIDAWALDLRGHGQSEGARAFIRSFGDYLDDLGALLELAARDRAEGPPVFLLGHSMGGLVVTRFVEERTSGVRGFALSSPFIQMKMRVPAWKRGLAHMLSSVWPSFGLPTGLDPDLLSRDPEVGRRYMADPLVLQSATTRWFTEAMGAQSAAIAKAGSVAIPALVMHGAADGIADPEGTKRLFEALGSKDKELKLWPELRHEPFNEPEGALVVDHVVSWLDARLAR